MPIQHLDLIKQAAQHILDESKLGNIDLSNSDTYTCHLMKDWCVLNRSVSEVYTDGLGIRFMESKGYKFIHGAFIHYLLKEAHGVTMGKMYTVTAQKLLHKYRVEWLEFIINYQEV